MFFYVFCILYTNLYADLYEGRCTVCMLVTTKFFSCSQCFLFLAPQRDIWTGTILETCTSEYRRSIWKRTVLFSTHSSPRLRTGSLARSSHSSRLWPWVSSLLPETRTSAFALNAYLSVSDSWTGVVRQVMAARPFAFIGFFFFVMTSAFVGKLQFGRSKL